MATKTITVTEDAYERLRALKREGESFSDVISRITATNVDRMTFAGSCPSLGDHAEEARTELEADLESSHDDLFGQ